MSTKFNVPNWTPRKVLLFWESCYGDLDEKWRKDFLDSPITLEISTFHPELIKAAIKESRRLATIAKLCQFFQQQQDAAIENYDKGPWVSAHLSQKGQDPFYREDSKNQFLCIKCNLKYSKAFIAELDTPLDVCRNCEKQD